ncbi:MAG: hypothetical protein IKO17_03895, partial [Prevotella sp.]|nr:hypothetical protein [Prevotella sp.]
LRGNRFAASLVEELLTSFNSFITKMMEMASRGNVGSSKIDSLLQAFFVTLRQSREFTPSRKKKQTRFFRSSLVFFVTLPSKMANLLHLSIKKIKIFCSALDFL